MVDALKEIIGWILWDILFRYLIWLIVGCLLLVSATPYILLISLADSQGYMQGASDRFSYTFRCWLDLLDDLAWFA